MKTYKILAIGNNFSEDAVTYLHQLAAVLGIATRVVNIYMEGCSLERHWANVETKEPVYQYQINGEKTEKYISIEEALTQEEWDVIVTQQAGPDSGWINTYEPFLELLVGYIKEKCPGAKLFLQETWAYEIDSIHGSFMSYGCSQQEMFEKLRFCYYTMADEYGLGLIPSGEVIQTLRKTKPFHVQTGGLSLCRDGYHMSYAYGRFALACTWVWTLFGKIKGKELPVKLSVSKIGKIFAERADKYQEEKRALMEEKPDPMLLGLIWDTACACQFPIFLIK